MEELISLADAAELLGVAQVTLRAARARGRFDAKLFGNTYVTTRAEVERYRRENLNQVGRPPDVLIEDRDRLGFYVRIAIKVRPSEIVAATALVHEALRRAKGLDDMFETSEFRLPSETGFDLDDAFLDLVNKTFRATVRRRATFSDGLATPTPYVSPSLTHGRAEDPKVTRRRRA